jgi:signal transduction histidine kinase
MFNILLAISGIILFIISAIVLYSNPKSWNNRWLSAFTMSGLIWLLSNLAVNISNSPEAALTFARVALIGATLIPLTFLMFCYSFTHKEKNMESRLQFLAYLPIIILLLLAPTSLNVKSVTAYGASYETGVAYGFLLLVLVIYFFLGIRMLFGAYRNSTGTKHQQIYYILVGTLLTLIPGIITNGVLPVLGYTNVASYGTASVLFFSVFTSFAIVRHKFLDIRLIVARALTYLFSFSIIIGILSLAAFSVANVLFDVTLSTEQIILFALFSSIAAVAFQPLKKFFDKYTNRLFYRDAYDPQEVLDGVNGALVASYKVEDILNKTATIITDKIKADFTVFALKETDTTPRHIDGTKQIAFSEADVQAAIAITSGSKDRVFNLDRIAEIEPKLAKVMRKYNIDVLVRMVAQGEGIGYLLCGPKKSGNPYSSQDLNLLDIIAGEVAIAAQNALRFEQIEQFNVTLQQKVVDATAKLQKSNEKLKALDEAKDEFISMASHQLRTPLTSVKGYISMLLEGDAGAVNKTQREFLDQAYVSSQRMVYLIADLLNVSRLKTGKFVIDAHPTFLPDTVESELAQLQETAKSRGLKLVFKKPKDFPLINLDETKTRQVIMNFADNAIYYTPKGGTVKAELTATKDTITFTITDNGIGVRKEDQHHLFTKFYRAGNARKARPDGTGLGLFMAKKVIVSQGGAVLFKSDEGKGSTFGFTFPRAKLEVK